MARFGGTVSPPAGVELGQASALLGLGFSSRLISPFDSRSCPPGLLIPSVAPMSLIVRETAMSLWGPSLAVQRPWGLARSPDGVEAADLVIRFRTSICGGPPWPALNSVGRSLPGPPLQMVIESPLSW